jgi:hypothetical protein
MTVSPLATRQPSPGKLVRARSAVERAHRLERGRNGERVVDVIPALAPLLPGRGLKPGCAYTVHGSTALVSALIALPSSTGAWCGVVGMPQFAAEGAAGLGVDLDRVVLIPYPGREWVNVVGALIDALPLVVVRPPGRVADAEAARLGARLRQREGVLVSCGSWPRPEATMTVDESSWLGLGAGHGHLTARRVEVLVTGRGKALRPRRASLWLPDPGGHVVRAEHLDGIPPEHPALDDGAYEAAG